MIVPLGTILMNGYVRHLLMTLRRILILSPRLLTLLEIGSRIKRGVYALSTCLLNYLKHTLLLTTLLVALALVTLIGNGRQFLLTPTTISISLRTTLGHRLPLNGILFSGIRFGIRRLIVHSLTPNLGLRRYWVNVRSSASQGRRPVRLLHFGWMNILVVRSIAVAFYVRRPTITLVITTCSNVSILSLLFLRIRQKNIVNGRVGRLIYISTMLKVARSLLRIRMGNWPQTISLEERSTLLQVR